MKGHLALRRVAVVLGSLCLALGLWYLMVRPTTLRVAVGPADSTVVKFIDTLTNVMKEARQPFRFRAVPAEGSADASVMLDQGRAQLAVLRSDDPADAEGNNKVSKDARSIVVLHKRAVILVVRKDAGIQSMRTIAGGHEDSETDDEETGDRATPAAKKDAPQKIAPATRQAAAPKSPGTKQDATPRSLPPAKQSKAEKTAPAVKGAPAAGSTVSDDPDGERAETGTRRSIGIVNVDADSYKPLILRLLSHFDVTEGNLDLQEMRREEVKAAMLERRIDGFFLVANPASRPSRDLLTELTGTGKLELVVLGAPSADALVLRFRDLHKSTVPQGVFGKLPAAEQETVGITLELTATSAMSEQTATALTKSLMEVRTRLRNSQSLTYSVETPSVEEERRFLPHAGTAAHVNSEAKTFLDIYSEYIWLGLFAVGLIGSGVAGVLSWAGLKREAPAETLADRMRLLAGRLESAATAAEVDGVQGDFDDLVLAMMREYGLRNLVEEGMPDPSPWLHTFSGLIARRRALLAELAPPAATALATPPLREVRG